MASPFSIFRKNQKVMMAVITIFAMFAFVLISPWGRGNSNPSSGPGVVVATWNFGKIYMADVDNRVTNRHMVNLFLGRVFSEAGQKGALIEGQRPPQFSETRQAALDAIVLHKKAEQLGLSVSDATVNQFINAVGDDKLSGAELDAALKGIASSGFRTSSEQIVNALRFELEANKFLELLQSDLLSGMTPEQRYDYFGRLHRRAVIQVLPVDVKDFVNKVPNPTDAELRALFEKYKENIANPESPEPGFKVPPKAKFQYFQAKVDDLINAEKPKVTDEEIKKYYEDHKERFKTSDESSTESTDKSAKPEKGATPDNASKQDQKNSDKSPATSDKTTPQNPAADKGAPQNAAPEKAKSDKTAADKIAPDTATPSKPMSDKGAAPPLQPSPMKPATTPADKPADSRSPDKSTPPSGKSSRFLPASPHLLAGALLALTEADTPATTKSADPKSAEKPAANVAKSPEAKPVDAEPADNKPADAKSTDAKPATEKNADKSPEKAPAASAEPPKATTPSGVPDLGLKPTDPLKKIPVVEYQSLDSVRDKIRTDLARERANKQIDEALKSLRSPVMTYQGDYSRWVALQGAQPKPPDFAALAKAKGFQFVQTDWLSAQQAYDTTDFGKSVVFTVAPGSRSFQSSVLQQAFDPRIQKYKPYDSYHIDPEIDYLWWRVDYKDAYVPKFEDAKSEVLTAFKMIEARKLAMAQAKDYAEQVKKQQAELQEVFKFRPELHPSKDIGPFTWLSVPATALNPEMQAPPQLTQLPGVEKISDDFMRTVFTMDVGSTGTSMNAPQTIVYVIQLKSLSPGEDQFRREFLQRTASRTDDSWRVEQLESRQMLNAKVAAISSEFDFKLTPEGTDALFGKGGSAAAPSDEGD